MDVRLASGIQADMIDLPPEVKDALPGAIGSGVALKWVPGSWWLKLGTWAGGCAIAYYVGPFVAIFFELAQPRAVSFSGFATGLVGMLLASKVFDILHAINAEEIGKAVAAWVRKRFGVQP